MSCIIPGGANQAETEENQSLVDATVPGGLWRSLKEADLLRADAPTPGNADGKL